VTAPAVLRLEMKIPFGPNLSVDDRSETLYELPSLDFGSPVPAEDSALTVSTGRITVKITLPRAASRNLANHGDGIQPVDFGYLACEVLVEQVSPELGLLMTSERQLRVDEAELVASGYKVHLVGDASWISTPCASPT
jgi:hypothetical protein